MSRRRPRNERHQVNRLKLFGGIVGLVAVVIIGVTIYQTFFSKLEASTVIKKGDFRLTVDNRWDTSAKKNYADLKWDDVPNLSQGGYQLYQSEDQGVTWENRSVNFGKEVQVLNIYPDSDASNTLKGWMTNPSIGLGLIKVTSMSMATYNSNVRGALIDGKGDYKYDVLMFGTWDSNNSRDLNATSREETKKFMDSGRGVLFGHDTIWANLKNFDTFKTYLGITTYSTGTNNPWKKELRMGSNKVKVTNNGYLMKYPHELANSLELSIPYAHSAAQMSGVNTNTKWLEFKAPFGVTSVGSGGNLVNDATYGTNNHYLLTKDNLGLIQTGHSNGQSTSDEMKILVNSLYNLAQVSLDTFASDQTVKDDKGPEKPKTPVIRAGKDGSLTIKTDAVDRGKVYQWYVDADTKNNGVKKSDTVQETILSNIAGYFYEITDSPTTNLKMTVEGYKDEFGRIDQSKFDAYVAPDDESLTYTTEVNFTVPGQKGADKYLHLLAVDRANNVGEIDSQPIDDLVQYVDFDIERTKDEAKIVNLTLDHYIDNKMKSLEVHVPKHAEIKSFSSLSLPTGWYSFENSETDTSRSFTFAMEGSNNLATIESFIKDLRVTLKEPVNEVGSIRLIFHEKVYTSWSDEEGVPHYYTFLNKTLTWPQAYNEAKKLSYKNLTGYLATVTTPEEHDFIYNNIAKKPGWLGGTRLTKTSDANSLVNDEKSIPETLYDSSKGHWYWSNGPESGIMYLNKATYDGGGRAPAGIYDGWVRKTNSGTASSNEPNNVGNAENAMIFAFKNKWFNDIPFNHAGSSNQGYYVEFSQYGNQVEKEELTDLSWEAAIPQKISLKAYDEKGAPLEAGNLIYDQVLRIGNQQRVEPKTIALYEFVKATNIDGSDRGLEYIIGETYQEGKLIYRRRATALHVRQIILEPTAKVEVPKQGTVRIESSPANKVTNKITSGIDSATLSYTPVELLLEVEGEVFKVIPLNLGFYEVAGYVLTTKEEPHQENERKQTVLIDSSLSTEFWLTIYLKPKLDNAIYLSMVNDQLHVYYANVEGFTVYIDGEKYEAFKVKNSPVVETTILDIPLNQARNKITVTYQDDKGNTKEAIWNNKQGWDVVKPDQNE
ncbi:hypothetical protein I6N95_17270 [Vagococcus sp. BWB3-3]|uniref:C-type lectin domain-containing protein n=1 Tax=Vagococcus allomyrinae TaxID=2794353 RepID=A0A940PFU5_9ENTE|nr:hypothetical protein [Vagococcus allomyrinae]MBP1042771.1 hypothetical protein [Vagococcus allomyrinae]